MKTNSRSSIRWGIATAVLAAALGALPVTFDAGGAPMAGKVALAGPDGNGRLVAAKSRALAPDESAAEENTLLPPRGFVDDTDKIVSTSIDQRRADGERIGDDSDVASVEGSANDDDAAASSDDGFDKTD